MSPYDDIPDDTMVKLRALNQLLRNSDIEKLYASDEAAYHKTQSLAETEIPPEVNEVVAPFLEEPDIAPLDVEVLLKPALLFCRASALTLQRRILATEVKEWGIRMPPEGLTAGEPTIGISRGDPHE